MNIQNMQIELVFKEAVLGGLPGNKELLHDHILSKAEKAKVELTDEQREEETASLGEGMEKGTTVFPKDDKGVFMWDYQFKGFLKESAKVLIALGDLGLSNYACGRVIDKTLFPGPRRLYLAGRVHYSTGGFDHL